MRAVSATLQAPATLSAPATLGTAATSSEAAVLSTMGDVPLQLRRLLGNLETFHGSSGVVTAVPGGIVETSYAAVGRNVARLAHALAGLGVVGETRVATFMWNNQQHVELYYAVPCMGAVLHPLNIRLPAEQVVFIANHADDRVVVVDHTLLPLFVTLLPGLKTVEHVVVNRGGFDGDGDGADAAAVDLSAFQGFDVAVHDYAALLAGATGSAGAAGSADPLDSYDWPDLDERTAAAMCYTSGTTGEPKGVVYSHRSIYLHALGAALPDVFDLAAADRVLAIVPQFHVLAWGLPYVAGVTGATLVLPGPFLGPEPLAGVIAATRPNKAAGVPTIWQGLLGYLQTHPEADVSSLDEAIVGGSACPPSLLDAYDQLGITLVHAWGMTETSPLGSLARPPAGVSPGTARNYRLTQGRLVATVQARVVGPAGEVLANDGASVGELEVKGPWVATSYYGADEPSKFRDGWLRTGDVGTISADGYLTLTDRVKDVIKSGGEWISSVGLENHLMSHPDVEEASVVGVADERWGERPLACVVLRPGSAATFSDLRTFLVGLVPRWQLPERWAVVDEVPKTSVGKFDKKVLRERYGNGEITATVVPGTVE